jgi:hypothetical protein
MLVLWNLAETQPKEMLPFVIFVKGILDFMLSLSNEQIRMLFETLALLSVLNDQASLLSEITIIIRKYLCSPNATFKNIGLLAGCSCVKWLGSSRASENHLNQANELVSVIYNSIKNSSVSVLIMIDVVVFSKFLR